MLQLQTIKKVASATFVAVKKKEEPKKLALTLDQFRQLFPTLDKTVAEKFLPYFLAAAEEHQINTPMRMAFFAAQLGHESLDLRRWREMDKNAGARYDVGRLAVILGNTPEADGDGYLYIGRSPIQITGKSNYQMAGKALGIDLVKDPERAEKLDAGFRIAGWYWSFKSLNKLADIGDLDAFNRCTLKINGGWNGKDDRIKRWIRACGVLGLPFPVLEG